MWLTPWFLLGLAGIALPLWLHRFAKQTDEKQPFASLMFLEPSDRAAQPSARAALLAAVGCCALLLLAAAGAGLRRSPVARCAG